MLKLERWAGARHGGSPHSPVLGRQRSGCPGSGGKGCLVSGGWMLRFPDGDGVTFVANIA